MSDESDPRAYMQLAMRIRKAIAAGEYQPRTPIPSITTMAQQYGHARQTCSKALGILVKEGLLVRYPGLGYYVTAQAGDSRPAGQESGKGQADEA